jgi:uncharacterized integral membrane protein
MALIRFIVLALIGSSLVLLYLQNRTTVTLVFLGAPTQALPLAVWILGAIALGTLTSVGFMLLLQLSKWLGQRGSQPRNLRAGSSQQANWRTTPSPDRDTSNWVDDVYRNSAEPRSPERTSWPFYSADDPPKTEYRSDSAYASANVQDPQPPQTPNRTSASARRSDRSKSNSSSRVVDADYRVIVPPMGDPSAFNNNDDDDDDWGFEEDEFEPRVPKR